MINIKTLVKNFVKKISVKNVIKDSFFRNVVLVASGTIISQAITMFFSPILTRLYGPESIGVLGVFSSIITIVMPIAALTYPVAIVLPHEDDEAKDIAYLSFWISLIISVILFIILLLFGTDISIFLQLNNLQNYLIFIPFVMFFSAINEVIMQWLFRKEKFKITIRAGILQSLIINILKLLLGIIAPTAASLIVITILSTGINTALLLFFSGSLFYILKSKKIKLISNKNLIKIAKKYKEFPLFRAPEAFINSISISLPILMLTVFFGPSTAGFYTISNSVLQIPVNLIGNSLGNVIYPRISKAYNEGKNISKMLSQTTMILFIVGLIPFGVIFIFGPFLFSMVFGEEWIKAGVYARWVGLWVFTSLLNKPAVKALPVIQAQRFHLIHTCATIILKTSALLLGGLFLNNDIITMALYGITGAILNIILIISTILKSRR